MKKNEKKFKKELIELKKLFEFQNIEKDGEIIISVVPKKEYPNGGIMLPINISKHDYKSEENNFMFVFLWNKIYETICQEIDFIESIENK